MAYIPTEWEDRIVERPLTFTMITNEDGSVTLIPAEGDIISEGTAFTASRLNNIEVGVGNAFEKAGGKIDGVVAFGDDIILSSNGVVHNNLVMQGDIHIGNGRYINFMEASGVRMDDYGDLYPRDPNTVSLGASWAVFANDGTRRLSIPIGTSTSASLDLTPPTNGDVTIGGGIDQIIAPKSFGTVSFLNGWSNYNATTYDTFRFTKLASGLVILRGLIKSANLQTVIGILPVGCRPQTRSSFTCFAGNGPCRVDVFSDGSIQQITGSSDFLALSSIAFYAEN